MDKCDCDRFILWLAFATAAFAIVGFEMEQRSPHSETRRQQRCEALLLEISQRLKKIEQELEKK